MPVRAPASSLVRAAAVAVAAVACGLAFAASPAGAAQWRVSATVTGTYTNSHGWTRPCPGSFAQRTTVDVALRPRFVSTYERGDFAFGARMRATIGGTWSLTGSYAPNADDPTGQRLCDPQKTVSCAGRVIGGTSRGDRRREANLQLARVGAAMVGHFFVMTTVMEDAPFRRELDPICNEGEEARTTIVPFYGLGGGIGSATARDVRFPRALLLGRRAFTVTAPTQRLEQCRESEFYTRCTERSTIRYRLRFVPA